MATDTIPHPATLADVIAELVHADAEHGRHDLAASSFSDLHNEADANEYLIEAAEALGFDMFAEGEDFPTMNAAIALYSERMARPCDACGDALGPALPRVTDEGTFHGIACPGDVHRVR